MDKIDHIVERAIEYTLHVLEAAPQHGEAARTGLERMRSNLTIGAPDHPALERLQAFLGQLDAAARRRALH
jgi:hypothetical protein